MDEDKDSTKVHTNSLILNSTLVAKMGTIKLIYIVFRNSELATPVYSTVSLLNLH